MYVHGQISIPFDIRMSSLSDAAMDTAGVLLGYRSLGIEKMMRNGLVVWNMFYFSMYWEFHHPN